MSQPVINEVKALAGKVTSALMNSTKYLFEFFYNQKRNYLINSNFDLEEIGLVSARARMPPLSQKSK
jgi:hypothetical protein